MKLAILIRPHAVGKMTVGQHLSELSGYKLFHNHLSIELVAPFFSFSTPEGRGLVNDIRQLIFEAFAKNDAAGYILTFVWAFELSGDRDYIESVTKLFEDQGHEVYWIELEADIDTRIDRNQSENRLAHKPSKRDVAWSKRNLIESAEKHRLNSHKGELDFPRYMRINNTHKSPRVVAKQIWEFMQSRG